MLEAVGLTKTFVRQLKKGKKETFAAVNDVSLSVERGQILGILGPNGAGKTTLLRMLGFLMQPDTGEVILTDAEGLRISPVKECKRHISYLSENTKLYTRFTVRELLTLVGELYRLSKEELQERMDFVLHTLDMEAFADDRIEKLSTGQKQRTSIARCLIANPELYILDEPTLGLDVLSAQAIVDFMKKERAKGKTVLYSTHYMEEAQSLCDKVAVIQNGVIRHIGTPAELMEKTNTLNLRDAFFSIIGEDEEEAV